ncbi:MAG: GH92 family glycosyl hydrolase [Labilibaculum antarcticum]
MKKTGNRLFLFLLTALLFIACTNSEIKKDNYVQYVDPYIGTGFHGHVFIGAHVPFGAIQVGPTNYIRGWDWCSGYHYSDSIMTGFSQTHLSGTGIGDLGDVLISPYTGHIKLSPGTIKNPESGYASKYTHKQETATAGYYSVNLLKYNIKAELTATERTAFHKYTYPANEHSHIAINLDLGIGWDHPTKSSLSLLNDSTLVGYRFSSGWAKDQRLFFAIRISKTIKDLKLFRHNEALEGVNIESDSLLAVITFPTYEHETVMLKVGISPVSEENAVNNIDVENPDWNFDNIVALAQEKWNKELSKIKIKSSDSSQLRTFYTAMYHAYTAPALFNDANGDYRGTDKKIYKKANFNNYSIFSLWDTYRAAHPFYTLTQKERVSDMVNSMLAIYQQQGKLPIWALHGNETDCMVGYSAVPVITDAIFKGFNNIDKNLAFEAMKASSMRDDYGVNYLKSLGYIPCGKEKESVSKAMEYAISDWCISQLANDLKLEKEATYYAKRGQAYKQYFDKKSLFMRAKKENGEFRTPFNPFKTTHIKADYTEGNAWQYTWLVPQDVEGLIKLFGSEDKFRNKLDSLFIVKGNMGNEVAPDISGLIGMYVHGNEPSHHIPYLYAYVGQQWKTAKLVRKIMDEMYTDQPDGLCGNEDCGQMSAWYLLSSMGFYQVNPANGLFILGSPLFNEASIQLEDNKSFTVKALRQSKENIYIQKASLNGTPIMRSYITYNEIMKGGELVLEMGNTPNEKFGQATENRPFSKILK